MCFCQLFPKERGYTEPSPEGAVNGEEAEHGRMAFWVASTNSARRHRRAHDHFLYRGGGDVSTLVYMETSFALSIYLFHISFGSFFFCIQWLLASGFFFLPMHITQVQQRARSSSKAFPRFAEEVSTGHLVGCSASRCPGAKIWNVSADKWTPPSELDLRPLFLLFFGLVPALLEATPGWKWERRCKRGFWVMKASFGIAPLSFFMERKETAGSRRRNILVNITSGVFLSVPLWDKSFQLKLVIFTPQIWEAYSKCNLQYSFLRSTGTTCCTCGVFHCEGPLYAGSNGGEPFKLRPGHAAAKVLFVLFCIFSPSEPNTVILIPFKSKWYAPFSQASTEGPSWIWLD